MSHVQWPPGGIGGLLPGLLLPVLVVFHVSTSLPHAAASQEDLQPFAISVNVDLVVLEVTVRDRKGHVVTGLGKEDLAVYEDGVRQTIQMFRHEDAPVTVGLVVDHSGSMSRKLVSVVDAAQIFVEASNPEDEMFVVNFNEHVSLGLPTGVRFTSRSEELAQAILSAPTTGMTALYDATLQGLAHLQHGSRNKKVLVVISDGTDNASRQSLSDVLNRAGQSSALIYTIGIARRTDPDRNPGVLKRMAKETGGEAYFPANLRDVVPSCERIAREIRSQYTLGYQSSAPEAPGAYRTIRVTASRAGQGKLDVRTRSGYLAAPAHKENN